MYVQDSGYAELIDVEKDDFQIMIRFKDRVLFQSGMAIIGAEGRDAILFIGAAIDLVADQVDIIKVMGHTDSIPQNSFLYPNNRVLGSARANAVVDILEESGLTGDDPFIQSISMADKDPIAPNDTPEGRALNRRVEIYITRKEVVDEETGPEVIIDDIAQGGETSDDIQAGEAESEPDAG